MGKTYPYRHSICPGFLNVTFFCRSKRVAEQAQLKGFLIALICVFSMIKSWGKDIMHKNDLCVNNPYSAADNQSDTKNERAKIIPSSKSLHLTSSLLFDDFNRPDNVMVGIPSSGGTDNWSEKETGSTCTPENGIVRIKNGILEMSNCNAGNLGSCGGLSYKQVSFDISSKYSTVFDISDGNLEWYFNMKESRSDPASLSAGAYGIAFVIGATESDFRSATASGYAVVFGESGTLDPIRLVSFTNGLSDAYTTIISVASPATKNNYMSVKVVYNPCTKTWGLIVRDDGAINFADPTTISGVLSTGINDTHTSFPLNFIGAYRSHNSSCEEIAKFDNITLPSTVSNMSTYVWNGASTDYQLATNWTPNRDCPKVNDILQFNSSSPLSAVVTNVPVQTIGQLIITDNRSITLKDAASDLSSSTLSISGAAGTDFLIDVGAALILDVAASNNPADAMQIHLNSGATGMINGTFVFRNSNAGTAGRPHRLLASNTNAITVNQGGIIRAVDLNGNPFGNTGAENIIHFNSGAAFEFFDGSNPFGLTQPLSKIVFQTGSIYRHKNVSTDPSLMGRTYSNFEFDVTSGIAEFNYGSTGNTLVVDTLKILSGSFLITGSTNSQTVNFNVKGDLIISNGAGFNYNPTIPSTFSFISSMAAQKINNLGTLNFGKNATFKLNSSFATSPQLLIESDFTIGGALEITQGTIHLSAGNITLTSTDIYTGSVSPVAGSITYGAGRFIVERYINTGTALGQHEKSWQLLSIPTYADGQTVNGAWQDGQLPLVSLRANYGTLIGSPEGTVAGFDVASPFPSMKVFVSASNSWQGITSTAIPILNQKGYMIFVRGDRTVNFGSPAKPTILATKGKIYDPLNLPPSTSGIAASKFESIGNPYASAIDFTQLSKSNIDDKFYVWDPLLYGAYGLGGYQTISNIAGEYKATPGGTNFYNATDDYRNIQSGQAFFVYSTPGSGSVAFTESAKASGSRLVNFTSDKPSSIYTALYTGPDVQALIADGNRAFFDSSFSNDVNEMDAIKMLNAGENLGLKRQGNILSVEARGIFSVTDTLFYDLSNLKMNHNYQIRFTPENMDTLVMAEWIDTYLKTRIAVNLQDSSNINILVTNDTASAKAGRFYMILSRKVLATLPLKITVTAVRKEDNSIDIRWNTENEQGTKYYVVQRSADAVNFENIHQQHVQTTTASNGSYHFKDMHPLSGDNYYRIHSMNTNGQTSNSELIKVNASMQKNAIEIFSNPVVNRTLHLKFFNQPPGVYQLQFSNVLGQLCYKKNVKLSPADYAMDINLPSNISTGCYQLKVISSNGTIQMLRVMISK